jgi:phosphomannomutase
MAVFSKASPHHSIKFGTDGWRALIAKEFTYDNLQLFLDGLAAYILDKYPRNKALIIGYDARFLADRFAEFAAQTLSAYQIPVKLIKNPVPTPVIAHAAREQDSCGALTFTASHNPPEYMGIKYIPEYAGPATVEITNAILERINDCAEAKIIEKNLRGEKQANISAENGNNNLISFIDPAEAYFRDIRKIVNFDLLKKLNAKKKVKVIYDPLYGCGRNYTNTLLIEAGFDVETLHDLRDPSFGGSMPDPSKEILRELQIKVLSEKASFGAANDGDADRFAYIGDDGEFYPANKSMPIILKYLFEERGFQGTVARTIATTHLLDDLADKFGQKHEETPVGFKWLCEIMRRENTLIACEESGGMSVLGHIPEKDGILAILLMTEVIAGTGKSLPQLWQEVQDFVGKKYFYDKLDLHLEGELKNKFMATFESGNIKELAGFKVLKVDTVEGAKIYLDNGSWFLARPSGTEAMCRVYFEGHDRQELDKLVKAIRELIA